jgi:hypothetical protein
VPLAVATHQLVLPLGWRHLQGPGSVEPLPLPLPEALTLPPPGHPARVQRRLPLPEKHPRTEVLRQTQGPGVPEASRRGLQRGSRGRDHDAVLTAASQVQVWCSPQPLGSATAHESLTGAAVREQRPARQRSATGQCIACALALKSLAPLDFGNRSHPASHRKKQSSCRPLFSKLTPSDPRRPTRFQQRTAVCTPTRAYHSGAMESGPEKAVTAGRCAANGAVRQCRPRPSGRFRSPYPAQRLLRGLVGAAALALIALCATANALDIPYYRPGYVFTPVGERPGARAGALCTCNVAFGWQPPAYVVCECVSPHSTPYAKQQSRGLRGDGKVMTPSITAPDLFFADLLLRLAQKGSRVLMRRPPGPGPGGGRGAQRVHGALRKRGGPAERNSPSSELPRGSRVFRVR